VAGGDVRFVGQRSTCLDRLSEPGKLYRLDYDEDDSPIYVPIQDQDTLPGALETSGRVHLA